MAKKPTDVFEGDMAGWEVVGSKPVQDSVAGGRPLSTPDRVAREQSVVKEKYLGAAPDAADQMNPEGKEQHSTLIRAKKKNALDDDVGAKTFVVTDGKIVGSQG